MIFRVKARKVRACLMEVPYAAIDSLDPLCLCGEPLRFPVPAFGVSAFRFPLSSNSTYVKISKISELENKISKSSFAVSQWGFRCAWKIKGAKTNPNQNRAQVDGAFTWLAGLPPQPLRTGEAMKQEVESSQTWGNDILMCSSSDLPQSATTISKPL